MKIMYRTRANQIDATEVLRETDKSVVVASNLRGERREAKRSEYQNYFERWEDAHAFLIKKAESELIGARRRLEIAQGHLGNIKGMKPPKVHE